MNAITSSLPRALLALFALMFVILAPRADAQVNVLVGSWSGSMVWNGGQAGSNTWVFNSDGSFTTNGGSTGRWALNGSALWMRYDTAPNSTLTGTVTPNSVVANGATADGTNVAVHLRLSRGQIANAPGILGTWTVTKIRDGSIYGTFNYTFYDDGTFSEPTGGVGRWSQTGGRIWFRYNEPPYTTFVGAFNSGTGAFEGEETWDGGGAGSTFVMSR